MKPSNILFYRTPRGRVQVDVLFHNDTLWLTQKQMSELFEVAVPAISKHLKNIFASGELDENSAISKMETTDEDFSLLQKKDAHELKLEAAS